MAGVDAPSIPQAVVLASDTGSRLYPLNGSDTPKALLPVGNRPLLSYSLSMVEASDIQHVIVVCSGKETAEKLHNWIESSYNGSLRVELRAIPEGVGSADALRAASDSLTASTVAVLSADVVSDVPLSAVLAAHIMRGAAASTLLHPRQVLASTETKPGKAPKNVEYIGLNKSETALVAVMASPDARKSVSLPLSAARREGFVSLRTDLEEAHVYVFSRAALMTALEAKTAYSSLQQDVLPWLVRHQYAKLPQQADTSSYDAKRSTSTAASNMAIDEFGDGQGKGDGGGEPVKQSKHPEGRIPCGVAVFLCRPIHFCARANTPQAYADINKEIATPALASRLLGAATDVRHENWMDPSTKLGSKATVGPGCIVAPACIIGDKATLKRAVLGRGVVLGRDVKVINSVLMDGVAIAEGAHIQASILCSGVRVEAHASLKDCQVGAGMAISEGADHRGEVLARNSKMSTRSHQHRAPSSGMSAPGPAASGSF